MVLYVLGNCPPTTPQSQHYHYSFKAKCWLRGGVGRQRFYRETKKLCHSSFKTVLIVNPPTLA